MTQPPVTEVVVRENPFTAATGDTVGYRPPPFPQFGGRVVRP